jgi:hypothetical protein
MSASGVSFPTKFDRRTGGLATFMEGAAAWVTSKPMAELFEVMGERPPRSATGGDAVATILGLVEISDWLVDDTLWDFVYRGGGERQEALEALKDDERQHLVIALADQLGLRSATAPSTQRRTISMALGGARRAPLTRLRWLLEDEKGRPRKRPERLVLLGSSRELLDIEREPGVVDDYAPDAETEFDLMVGAGTSLFGLRPDHPLESSDEDLSPDDVHERRRWWTWDIDGMLIDAVQAPTRRPGKRVNTFEQVQHAAAYLDLGPEDAVVISTSAIYVPYQQAVCVRALESFGCAVQTVGHPIEWNPAAAAPNLRSATNYLQEIRNTFKALLRLAGGPKAPTS